MTGKADFTEDEWTTIAEGPTSAGLMVAAAQRGGTFRESMSMAKAYSEARQAHGESELLDTIVSSKPDVDHTRARSHEEMKAHALNNVSEAAALVDAKATPEEANEYKLFVVNLAQRVAEASKEVSDSERVAVQEIADTLGVAPPAPSAGE